MHRCKNPECGKEISEDKAYCNEECLRQAIKLRKRVQKKPFHTNYENELLANSTGKKIELELSRGRPVRGILVDYDPEFQKLTVMEDASNNQKKITVVRLGYVSALSVYQTKETETT